MTYWQFCEAVEGWVAAHVKGADKGISAEEEEMLGALIDHSSA